MRAPHTRAHVGRRCRSSSCIIFVVYSTVGRTCSKKTACLNFLCLLPMFLKTRGLGTGATFMRGSYVAEPRLLAWLRERTVLEHELHAIYRECLKLNFAFATQSSLSKVRNDNVRNAVPTRGTCRARTAVSVLHAQTCSRNPLLRYRTLSQDLHQS